MHSVCPMHDTGRPKSLPRIPERSRRGAPALAAFLLAVQAIGCATSPTQSAESQTAPPAIELRSVERSFHGRRTLYDARMFRKEGRYEAAERALQRGLRVNPDDPLAALAVLEETAVLPPMDILAALRPSEIGDPDAFGPKLAARVSKTAIAARTAFAPDGSPIARYYFAAGEALPLLREEDTTFDGTPDRWTRYRGSVRREVWEDGRGTEIPDVHVVFGLDGTHLQPIELDTADDGKADRIFHYASGALEKESRDTTGDGRMNRIDRFGADGNLKVSERDLDGDGIIDVRDYYDGGRLIRREFTSAVKSE